MSAHTSVANHSTDANHPTRDAARVSVTDHGADRQRAGLRAASGWGPSGVPGPAGGRPLGNPANNAATPGQSPCQGGNRQARREHERAQRQPGADKPLTNQQKRDKERRSRKGRFDARRRMRPITNLGRVAWCGKTSRQEGGEVALKLSDRGGGNRTAGLGGVQTCGSLWACPVCSAKITSKRTGEVEKALAWNANRGGSIALLTLTMRHHAGQSLKSLWDALSGAWRHMTSGRAWKTSSKELGRDHYIRATEVTHGDNGWHVHAHVLLFFNGPVSDEIVDTYGDQLYERWSEALATVGMEANRTAGVDVRRGQGALDGLGKYLSKLTYEAVGGRWKSGRKGGRTPFEILHDALETGLADDVELWWQWEKASKGRRQLTWSRQLKDLAEVEEKKDEEVAAEDDDGDVIAILPKKTWQRVEPEVEDLLTYTEDWGADGAYRWLTSRGLAYRLPGDDMQVADLWGPDPTDMQ